MKFAWFPILLGLALAGCTKGGATDDSSDTDDTGDTSGPTNDTISTATELEFDSDGLIQETYAIEKPGDRDFYKFSVTEGNWYILVTAGYTAGGGSPDTVLRVYDQDETMIGENDDQPYRWGDTDSGYLFRARYTGTYYAEVLEWSDWADESPDGGADWAYDFVAVEWPDGELLDANATGNDTRALAIAAMDTLDDSDTTNDLFQQYSFPISDFYGYGFGWSPGDISSASDVDYFGFRADTSDASYTGEVLQIGAYPGADTDWDPTFQLVDADGTVVADASADPEITTDYPFFWRTGITFPIGAGGGDYFLVVKDASGGSGPTHWYDFITASYPATYVPTTGPSTIQVVMETNAAGTSVFNMTESSTTTGYFYGRGSGWLNDDDTDGIDIWKLTAASVVQGGTLNVTTDVAGAGSLISDLKVEVFASDPGSGSPTAATSDTGLDPVITDFSLPAVTGNNLWLKVTSTSGSDGFYNILVSVE